MKILPCRPVALITLLHLWVWSVEQPLSKHVWKYACMYSSFTLMRLSTQNFSSFLVKVSPPNSPLEYNYEKGAGVVRPKNEFAACCLLQAS